MKNDEAWAEVPSFPGYLVSNLGRIRSPNKILSNCVDSNGYVVVGLWADGKETRMSVHRLVAGAFVPNPENLPQVNHKDEIRHHNHHENLEWCDNQYNSEYSQSKNYTFMSPDSDVVEVFNLNKFCKENNLNCGHMSRVHSGKLKQHKGWRVAS